MIVWQEAHKLVLLIYSITKLFPASEKYNLTSQMRRAAISQESCIAEGFCRYHYKERLNFYYDARGSLGELLSQAISAKDLTFLSNDKFNKIVVQIEVTSMVLGGLIRETERRSLQQNPS